MPTASRWSPAGRSPIFRPGLEQARQLRGPMPPTSILGMEELYCFAGNPLDRASERRRDSAWIASLLDDRQAVILPLHELRPLTRGSNSPVLDWQQVSAWRERIDK